MNTITDYTKQFIAATWMWAIGTRGEFRALKHETAFVISNSLSADVCRDLVAHIDELANDPKHPRVWRDETASDTRILGFEMVIGELSSHFDVERRIRAIDAYTGRTTKSWFLMANRVVPKEGNRGSGGGMHRDSAFSHQVKCIWYLNDVSSDNGPFQYVPGTHFDVIKRRSVYPVGQYRFEHVQDDLVEVKAKAGSLLVCDTKCIHGGKRIDNGVRYAVTLYTQPTVDGAANIFRKSGLDPKLAIRRPTL